MDLEKIALEIRDALEKRRKEIELTFVEDDHIYFMKDLDGVVKTSFPSVSTVLKNFYTPFNADKKAGEMCEGDEEKKRELLAKWKHSGDYATNMGSRVHYILEEELIKRYDNYKEVRKPIFDCDDIQTKRGDKMIEGGNSFIDKMLERGAVLLDTESVLGDPELGYTGQPDKGWLMMNKSKTDFGLVISDWKTNKEKNFQIQPYTGKMLHPFQNYHDTALTHYYLQLPLYAKLMIKMLQGTKFENMKFLGGVVVHLKDDGTHVEYKIPHVISQSILNMNKSQIFRK